MVGDGVGTDLARPDLVPLTTALDQHNGGLILHQNDCVEAYIRRRGIERGRPGPLDLEEGMTPLVTYTVQWRADTATGAFGSLQRAALYTHVDSASTACIRSLLSDDHWEVIKLRDGTWM